MKDWILKHKKIYFAVVIGIALALFMAITVRGCNKLEKAYAATVEMYDLSNMVWANGSYSDLSSAGNYIIVLYGDNTQIFLFNDEPLNIPSDGKVFYDYRVDCYLSSEGMKASFKSASDFNFQYINCKPGTATAYGVLGSNYDYTGDGFNGPHSNMTFPWIVPPINYAYSVNYPYLQYFDGAYWRDDGYVGWWLHNLKKYAEQGTILNTAGWVWYCDFGLIGDVPACDGDMFNIEKGRIYADVTVDAIVPSPAYIQSLIQSGYSPIDVMDYDLYKSWLDDVRLKNDDNAIKFSFVRNEKGIPFIEMPYVIDFSFSTIDIRNALSGLDGSEGLTFLRNMYGLSESEWAIWSPIIYGYFTMDKIISTCYCAISATEYVYGPTTVYRFLETECEDALEIVIREDIFNESLPDDYIDRVINQSVSNKVIDVKDSYESLVEKFEDMEQQYTELGKFGIDFEGGNLWTAIKGLGSGLLNMSGTFGSIGSAIGQVFSFIPSDILSIIFYSVTAMCLIAVWKMLRG